MIFFKVCRPIMFDGTDCRSPMNLHRYIEEFTCSNPEVTEKILKDIRLSFPSANASFSFYSMVFSIVSLAQKKRSNNKNLMRSILLFPDLSSLPTMLERFKPLEILSSTCIGINGVVYIAKSDFRLQASL